MHQCVHVKPFFISLFLMIFLLARQALYHLSQASIPFCSAYFGDMFLCFAQAGLHCGPPILCIGSVARMIGVHQKAFLVF
jgi:hypothetical protein